MRINNVILIIIAVFFMGNSSKNFGENLYFQSLKNPEITILKVTISQVGYPVSRDRYYNGFYVYLSFPIKNEAYKKFLIGDISYDLYSETPTKPIISISNKYMLDLFDLLIVKKNQVKIIGKTKGFPDNPDETTVYNFPLKQGGRWKLRKGRDDYEVVSTNITLNLPVGKIDSCVLIKNIRDGTSHDYGKVTTYAYLSPQFGIIKESGYQWGKEEDDEEVIRYELVSKESLKPEKHDEKSLQALIKKIQAEIPRWAEDGRFLRYLDKISTENIKTKGTPSTEEELK